MAREQLPLPGVPIPELRVPDHTQVYYRETVSREDPRFFNNSPIKRGVLYSSLQGSDVRISKAYPLLYFVRETVPIGSNTIAGMTQDQFVIWEWAVSPDAESTFNAEVSYLADAVANQVFARAYTIRRDVYDTSPAIATGTPLTALIGVEITAGGEGYKYAEAEFDCYGSEAEIDFVLSDGAVISGIVKKEGLDFNEGSVINIVGDGSGATCEPIIQPVEAVLTSQKKLEFSDGDPMQHEFVKVLRVYEVLPGPWVPFTRYDDDLGPVQGRRRAVLNTGQRGGVITQTGRQNFEGRDGSSVVLIEIQENWSNGTGLPSPDGTPNPVYPIVTWSLYNDERGTVRNTSQMVVNEGFGSFATFVRPSAGKIVKTWYEPYPDNPFLLKKRTEAWTEVVINDAKVSSIHGGGILAVTERTNEPGVQPVNTGLFATDSYLRTKSPDEQTLHSEFLFGGGEWPPNYGFHTDEVTGIVVNFVKQVIDAETPYPGTTPQDNDCSLVKIQGPFIDDQPYDRWKTIRITSAVDLNTLPKKQCWPINHPVNFPPQLLSIGALWSDNKSRSTEARANLAKVGVSSGSSCDILIESSSGYRGYAKGTQSREYFFGPPNAGLVPYPLKIIPSSGSVVITQTNSKTDASNGSIVAFSDAFSSQVFARDIRDHLVGAYQVYSLVDGFEYPGVTQHMSPAVGPVSAIGGSSFISIYAGGTPAFITIKLPQSNPPQLISGSTVIMEAQVVAWRFGIFVMDVISVVIP